MTATTVELRKAFAVGACAHGASRTWADNAARVHYPAPTVTRVREVGIAPWSGRLYRIREGVLEVSFGWGWTSSSNARLVGKQLVIDANVARNYPEAVPGFIALAADPTETVEVEA